MGTDTDRCLDQPKLAGNLDIFFFFLSRPVPIHIKFPRARVEDNQHLVLGSGRRGADVLRGGQNRESGVSSQRVAPTKGCEQPSAETMSTVSAG